MSTLTPVREIRTPAVPVMAPARPRRNWLTIIACCAGFLTIVGSLLLPLAPVQVNSPSISWPQAGAAPTSTLLPLEAGKPLGLRAEFSCHAVDAAAAATTDRASNVLLATADPDQPGRANGLRIIAKNGRLSAFTGTTAIFDEPITPGPCQYKISTEANRLVYTKDGQRLGTSVLPDVDALITSATTLSSNDLSLTLRIDDRFADSPTPLKSALIGLVAVSAAIAIGCLYLLYRRRTRKHQSPHRRRRIRPADLLVGAVLIAWLFLAPRTNDDGWMYSMAINAQHSGFFGNYYMYHDNSYVPFTWLLWIYAWWAKLGISPVLLRVPSLVFAIITWAGVRSAVADVARGRRLFVPALLFLAWWLPFGLGTRQEASVAACLTVAVAAVIAARRRQQVAYLGLAVASASLGLIAHPAGVLVLLPLLLGGWSAARLIRRSARSKPDALAIVACVFSCAVVSAFAAFASGSLGDFLRGSSSFGGTDNTTSAHPLQDELDRYRSLLGDTSLGNFALRTPVLLLLLIVPFFVFLCVRARSQRRPLPWPMWITGWTCTLGLGFLVITPSKWTWHFGAFAGVATIFLTWCALRTPQLVRSRRIGVPLLTGLVVWTFLSGLGPNAWADDVLPGVPLAGKSVLSVVLPLTAIAVVLLIRPRRGLVSVGKRLTACFLVVELGFLVGGFGVAVARTWDTWSPWTDAIKDPLGQQCGEARMLRMADPGSARPVDVLSGSVNTNGFAPDVWYSGSPPEPGPATAQVYGNTPGQQAQMTTPWLRLPRDLSAQHQLMTTVSGMTGNGNSLSTEFATSTGKVLATSQFTQPEDDLDWRDVAITDGANLPAGTAAFRMTAKVTRNWFSFAMPTERQLVPVSSALPHDGRTLVDWQLNWLYPCQGQPVISDGIVAPISYVVGFGFGPDGTEYSATNGGSWASEVGGILSSQSRSSSRTRLYTVLDTNPTTPMRTVYRLNRPYADNAYQLNKGSTVTTGWDTAN